MIGLIFIFFIGKAFYVLAETHGKSKWGFAILGIASYYLGTVVGGIIIAILYELFMPGSLEDVNEMVIGLIALPVGILSCWGFYKILQSKWSKQPTFTASASEDILDADMIERKEP